MSGSNTRVCRLQSAPSLGTPSAHASADTGMTAAGTVG
jgi:hypothetical protein